jgi:hypothetical protein
MIQAGAVANLYFIELYDPLVLPRKAAALGCISARFIGNQRACVRSNRETIFGKRGRMSPFATNYPMHQL